VVGTPIAGRERSETEGLIGFFLNSLALRADLSGNPTPEPSTTALLLLFLPVAWVAFRARRNSQNRGLTSTK